MSNTHDVVAHNWAHQTGRAQRGFNMFYDGDTIYSYGRHFPIARLTTDASGRRVVLFTTEGYSVSTAKHKSIVWRAVSHLPMFHVARVEAGPWDQRENHADMVRRMGEALERAARARTHAASYLDQAQRLANEANNYSEAFGLGLPRVELPTDLGPIKERIARARVAAKQEAARREASMRDAAIAWVKGERDYAPRTELPYVRVKGDKVQTSWGITVPLGEALRAFHLAEQCAVTGREFRPSSPISIGGWQLDHISSQGAIRAGCHLIPLERQRLAASRLLPVVIANA